jgi:hypothetical protein
MTYTIIFMFTVLSEIPSICVKVHFEWFWQKNCVLCTNLARDVWSLTPQCARRIVRTVCKSWSKCFDSRVQVRRHVKDVMALTVVGRRSSPEESGAHFQVHISKLFPKDTCRFSHVFSLPSSAMEEVWVVKKGEGCFHLQKWNGLCEIFFFIPLWHSIGGIAHPLALVRWRVCTTFLCGAWVLFDRESSPICQRVCTLPSGSAVSGGRHCGHWSVRLKRILWSRSFVQ